MKLICDALTTLWIYRAQLAYEVRVCEERIDEVSRDTPPYATRFARRLPTRIFRCS